MKRSLIVSAVVATLGLISVGCRPEADGLVANAPAVNSQLNGRIPSTGNYVLFRVNSVDPTTRKPTSVTQVGSYQLQEGEHVGFEWVPDTGTTNTPESHMDLVAFAGSQKQNLGPIKTLQEHYYWATEYGFNHYWTFEPALGFYNKVTLQQ